MLSRAIVIQLGRWIHIHTIMAHTGGNRPLHMELDARNVHVQDQVAFFERAKTTTTSTSLALSYLNFNQRSVRKAAVSFFRSCIMSSNERQSTFEELSLVECPESPFLEVVLASAVECGIFRSILVKGPVLQMVRRVYVSMLLFDERRGGFPQRLDTLVLDSIMLTQRDADFLCGALGIGDVSPHKPTRNPNKKGCQLKRFALRNILWDGDGTLRQLCDGFRRNTSLQHVEVTPKGYWRTSEDVQMLLESLSRHPQLKSLQVASLFTSQMKEILPGVQPAPHLNVLALPLTERRMNVEDAHFTARHTLRLLTLYPQLSQVCIWPSHGEQQDGQPIFGCVPSGLASQIRHLTDINYAGRRLILSRNGKASNDCPSESKAVPIGLWPLVLERCLKPSCSKHGDCSIPSNRFNGIYYLLRWGPILLEKGTANDI